MSIKCNSDSFEVTTLLVSFVELLPVLVCASISLTLQADKLKSINILDIIASPFDFILYLLINFPPILHISLNYSIITAYFY